MPLLTVIIDVDANPSLWDPEEIIEEILAHGDELPTFAPDATWTVRDAEDDPLKGRFVSAEWAD